MKAKLNRQEFAEALSAVVTVAAARTPKPILQCVLLEAKPDHCLLAATDLELGIRCPVAQVEVDTAGQVVLPADKLSQIVRESNDEVLSLETDESVCHIRGQDAHYQMYVQDPADFPPVADLQGGPDFEVPADALRRMADWTVFAAARENTRYAINGVLWEKQGEVLTLVATDGRRLAYARTRLPKADDSNMECIVSTKAMHLFQRVAGDAEQMVAVKRAGNQIVIRSPRATISSALVEGQFPRYRDVIPTDNNRSVQLNTAEFLSAVRRAALLTNEESKGVRLGFSHDTLTLSSRAPSQGEAEITLPIKFAGGDLEIGFNPHFLVEVLKVVDTDQVTLDLKEPNRPGLLKESSDYQYVVMPVSLS